MTDDIVARMRRHARVPFEKIERKAAFDAAKRIVKDRNADIVVLLRAIVTVSGGVANSNVDHIVKAADEIERLRRHYSEAEKDHVEYVAKYHDAKMEIERLLARVAELEAERPS